MGVLDTKSGHSVTVNASMNPTNQTAESKRDDTMNKVTGPVREAVTDYK
jgi:hypothetical protein